MEHLMWNGDEKKSDNPLFKFFFSKGLAQGRNIATPLHLQDKLIINFKFFQINCYTEYVLKGKFIRN